VFEHEDKYNALKGVSIFFVVTIHYVYKFFTPQAKPFSVELMNYLTSFAVPLFLIMGGYFFSRKFLDTSRSVLIDEGLLKASFLGLLKRIVLPYYMFSIFLSLYDYSIGQPILWTQFLFIDSNSHGLYYLIIYTYAFLFCLSFVFIAQFFLNKKLIVVHLTLLSLISFCIIPPGVFVGKGVVFRQLPLIAFFCIGVPLYFVQTSLVEQRFKGVGMPSLIGAFFIISVVLTCCIVLLRKIFGPFPVFTSAPPTIWRLLYSSIVFLIILNLLSLEKLVTCLHKSEFVAFGSNSLFIFLIHPYLIKIVYPVICYLSQVFSLTIYSNAFLIVILVVAFITTIISDKLLWVVPDRIRRYLF